MALLFGAFAAPSKADVVDIDLFLETDIDSFDLFGDPDNLVFLLDLSDLGVGPGSRILGIGWEVELFADDPSWLSEMGLYVSDSTGTSLDSFELTPGAGDNFPGTSVYSSGGVLVLTDFGLNPLLLPDGLVYLEFFELFDDYEDDWDGIWLAGSVITLRFDAVPEPSSGLAIAAGAGLLGLTGLARRRRRAA